MFMSMDAEKAFDKIQHSFMIKALSKLRMKGSFFKRIKNIYKKSTADIIFNGEKLDAFSVRSGTIHNVPSHHSYLTSYGKF